MGFKESKNFSLNSIAKEIEDFWVKNDVFIKSSNRDNGESFVFFEGPPSANGKPGIHHVLARTIKDAFCRYKTIKGFNVKRKAGWDTHGLPVELGVEKELGISKDDIGNKISVSDYNAACKEAVMKYTSDWESLTKEMGYWIDMSDPYVTFESKYMESVWWIIKNIYDKNLIYKGYTVQPYSPAAGSGLSSHELNQPGAYRDISDTSVVAQFKSLKEGLPDELINFYPFYFLAWTTTPWTLPSNTALTIGEKIQYSFVKTYNQYTKKLITVVIATKLIDKIFSKIFYEVKSEKELASFDNKKTNIPYLICHEVPGKNLENIKYERIWDESPLPLDNPENAFRLIIGDFVTTDSGTGIVHTAPTFGADDYKAAKSAKPEVPPLLVIDKNGVKVPLVDLKGKFIDGIGLISGKYVKNEYYESDSIPEKSVDVEIAIRLKEINRAFKVEKYSHSYPHCWRTDKPVLYYPMESWFIKMDSLSNRMFELNKEINWKPKSTGEGRFGNWLKSANDWNLSRSRFWGIPLPIWTDEENEEVKVIGSAEELINEIEVSVKRGHMLSNPYFDFVVGNMSDKNYLNIDLHKDTVDDIILTSSKGKPMKREKDIIDVWFDSGSMPYAQFHYPFENKDLIDDNINFPADFIAEGVDQTRGWFYTLHAISTLVFDSISYKNVVSNGLVLDKNGQKMSKRLGNTVNPFKMIEEYGADAVRWYMISNSNPWDNLKFDQEGVAEVKRKLFGTLHNVYSFFSLYANIDKFSYKEDFIELEKRSELDQWIISELNSLIKKVDNYFNEYELTPASREISDFIQEKLSNWYVRLSRRRFWKGEYNDDKISAYQTLYECLSSICKLISPIAPFYSEYIYQCLNTVTKKEYYESVHLSEFPISDEDFINPELENKINKVRNICSLALSIRKKEKLKVRQPLSRIIIPVKDKSEKNEIENAKDQILSEINVKSIEFLNSKDSLLIKELIPNFKILGPRYGSIINDVANIIKGFSQKEIEDLESNGKANFRIKETDVSIDLGDVEINYKDIEGLSVASGDGTTIALDLKLDQNLINEGIARELVNRIQNIRKSKDLEVTDKIEINIKKSEKLANAIKSNLDYIKGETLANKLYFSENFNDEGETLEFDDIKTVITVNKI
ncbi:MAG: isoleucine--tRNA ligase [Flavobacteriaceae bacterium]|nr:isoleucine--tRNA ligase [Cryomorphaceae bacterium]MBL6677587.1 isoleucine--tRNA ligase [Flavobacteriaceae bacterium]MDA0331181.1 isoleucine--tRNA ligase [Bacteroidota bacterium]MDA1225860.1 isoleucine--tRNA ligase [Bacteroidota bacterium]